MIAFRMCAGMLVLTSLGLNASATTVWTWVDEQGVTHYSQTPAPGAKRLEIGPSNRAQAYTPRPVSGAPAPPAQATAAAVSEKYAEFAIVEPADGATLWNIGGALPVNLRLDPMLRAGHRIALYLNDRRLEGLDARATKFNLEDVHRGAHLLVAVVHDEDGASLQRAAVTFHVHQTTIARPKPEQPLPKRN